MLHARWTWAMTDALAVTISRPFLPMSCSRTIDTRCLSPPHPAILLLRAISRAPHSPLPIPTMRRQRSSPSWEYSQTTMRSLVCADRLRPCWRRPARRSLSFVASTTRMPTRRTPPPSSRNSSTAIARIRLQPTTSRIPSCYPLVCRRGSSSAGRRPLSRMPSWRAATCHARQSSFPRPARCRHRSARLSCCRA